MEVVGTDDRLDGAGSEHGPTPDTGLLGLVMLSGVAVTAFSSTVGTVVFQSTRDCLGNPRRFNQNSMCCGLHQETT